jgi:hypothetical protein
MTTGLAMPCRMSLADDGSRPFFTASTGDEFADLPEREPSAERFFNHGNCSTPCCMGRMSYRREPPRYHRPFHTALLAKTMTLVAMTYVISIIK